MSTLVDPNVIQVHTGRYVDPFDLKPEDIAIEDIAHSLANQCRFSGHVSKFYSVAEHSVRVSRELAVYGLETQLWGLLHDASEAYLVDIPRPIKATAGFGSLYKEAEADAMKVIASVFGLDPVMPAAVRRMDDVLLMTEKRDLLPQDGSEWEGFEGIHTLPGKIEPWSPEKAKAVFLAAHFLLLSVMGRS